MKEIVTTKRELCTGCNRCVRECPMEMANITYQDENGNIKVYANTYDPNGVNPDLGVINSEKEWQMIENLLSSLQEKIGDNDGTPQA